MTRGPVKHSFGSLAVSYLLATSIPLARIYAQIDFNGERLRNPCEDAFSPPVPAPAYEIINLVDRGLQPTSDLRKLKRSQMVVLSDRAINDSETKKALRDNEAILCLKLEDRPEVVLNSSVKLRAPILIAIPRDVEGINHLYAVGNDANTVQPLVKQMNRVLTSLDPIKDRLTYLSEAASDQAQRDKVLQTFRDAKEYEIITLVCHNEGGMIKFPDGSNVTLGEISDLAKAKKLVPLILSCNTIEHISADYDGLVSTKALYFEEMVAGLLKAQDLFTSGNHCCYLGDYLYAIDVGIKQKSLTKGRIAVTVKIVGGVVILVCLALWLDDERRRVTGEEIRR